MALTVITPAAAGATHLLPASGPQVVLRAAQDVVRVTTLGQRGPQGPAGPPGSGGAGTLPPLVVDTSRAMTANDAGRVLQVSHGVQITLPNTLAAGWAAPLLCPAAEVAEGGTVAIALDAGVTLNGASTSPRVISPAGDSPWMAWLQGHATAGVYSLVMIGATVSDAVASLIWQRTDALWLDPGPIWA